MTAPTGAPYLPYTPSYECAGCGGRPTTWLAMCVRWWEVAWTESRTELCRRCCSWYCLVTYCEAGMVPPRGGTLVVIPAAIDRQ